MLSRYGFAIAAFYLLPLAAIAQTPPPPAPPAAAAKPAAPVAPAAPAVAAAPATDKPVTHAELPGLVKQAILDNPDMLMEAIQKLRDKQLAQTEKDASDALQKHKTELFSDTKSPSAGDAKNGDITIVEFFDYHCGYCKQLFPSISRLLDEDKKVHIIFREFPILAEDSVTASRAALAVNNIAPDKYFAFHSLLMKSSGHFDEKTLVDAAKKVGISGDKLKAEMKNPDITTMLDVNRKLADDLGIRGTPALAIGDQLIPGALPYDDLHDIIEEQRGSKAKKPADAAHAVPSISVTPKD